MTKYPISNINYKVKGKGKNIVLLHGWAKTASGKSMEKLQEQLATQGYKVWTLDLPGFGKSPKAPDNWGTKEFSTLISSFIQEKVITATHHSKRRTHNVKRTTYYLLGHSFGGSLTAYIAAHLEPKPKKIILCASAGLRYKTIKAKLLLPFSKIFKSFLNLLPDKFAARIRRNIYYYLIRERDYVDTSDKKEQFVRITSTDLTETFKQVAIPTLIIWGKDDKVTPLKMGKKINELIPNSKLEVIEGRHGIPITNPEKITHLVKEFLK